MMRSLPSFGLAIFVVACGAQSAPPQTASPALRPQLPARQAEPTQSATLEEDQSPSAAEPPTQSPPSDHSPGELIGMLPPDCGGEAPCEPPREFTRAVCKGQYPGLALKMFEKNSPWKRLYLKAESLEPINAYGGRATSHRIDFGEEVLVLRGEAKQDQSKVQVSGATDIDLLRWDGTCITARREMWVTYMMPETKNATIHWRHLDDNIKEALLEQKYVKLMYDREKVACRSSRSSNPAPDCEKATQKLNDAITVAIRGGMSVPEPEKLPRWATPEQAVARAKGTPQPEARSESTQQ